MNLLLIGGGEIALLLCEELHRKHTITVLEANEQRLVAFENYDVQALVGNGTDGDDLRAAGAERADAVLALTGNDDVNILSALAAHGFGATRTLALVSRDRYLHAFSRHGPLSATGLNIDSIMWPQRSLARQIADIVQTPRIVDHAELAGGRLLLNEYEMRERDPFLGKPLAKLELPKHVLVAGVLRNDAFHIPTGTTRFEPGDTVTFIGEVAGMHNVQERFAPSTQRIRVLLVGGGNVGFMVSELLSRRGVELTIIEVDPERAEHLAKHFPRALVLLGDGTDVTLLEQEGASEYDVVVAVTSDDATNLLISLLAKQFAVPKVITRVFSVPNRRLFRRVGIDAPIAARGAIVADILNWLDIDIAQHLASIDGFAEVAQLDYPADAHAGRIAELGTPAEMLIVGIMRGEQTIVPTGATKVKPGDSLLVVTLPELMPEVEAWLHGRVE